MSVIISANNITKAYKMGSENVYALNNINVSVDSGEIVSVVGPSGSGKTTLVNVLGCIDTFDSGSLFLDNVKIDNNVSESELTKIRRKFFGYVFQKFFLIPTLTVKENILLPLVFQGIQDDNNLDNVLQLLEIKHRKEHLPSQLSGGEMQRVAIARAIINNPPILIADEPTGNLDSRRSNEIEKLLLRLNKEIKNTIILVTHDQNLAKIGNKIINIVDGMIV
ncbi:MAG: ABC transporter ATP-binding protein [Rickettsiales bacterium]|nr:ABC transporter ATP-binding protein [Rickettsiales bacterium]